MAQERTEDDIALGVIPLTLGERQYVLRTLPWDASDEWQALAQERLRRVVGIEWTKPDDLLGLVRSSMSEVLDLVHAYDRDRILGASVAELRRKFDKAQIYETFKAIARHEFPFLTDATSVAEAVMPVLRPILYEAMTGLVSQRLESSNGSPPPGGSTPEPSEPISIDDRSGSTGKRARSA